MPEGPVDIAANPKFDEVASQVQLFQDLPDARAASASPDRIADLLIHAAAALSPSDSGGFSVPPDYRLTQQPDLAVGA